MRLKVRHYGPGPHKNGTPQSVHGRGGMARWKNRPQIPYSAPVDIRQKAEAHAILEIDRLKPPAAWRGDYEKERYAHETLAALKQMCLEEDVVIFRGIQGATGVVNDGRFKTQFETGTSGGTFEPGWRAEAERNGLGYPEQTAPEQRPVYGTLGLDGRYYGNVGFHLKDAVKARCTVTVGDSLPGMKKGEQIGTPALNPGQGSLANPRLLRSIHDGEPLDRHQYIEMQVHGGVRLSDVKAVTMFYPEDGTIGWMAPVYKGLVAAGIPVDFHGWDSRQVAVLKGMAA